jgi:hypothetical protein
LTSEGFSLRLLNDSDLPALQRLYEDSAHVFERLTGRAAGPEQAAADFVDALQNPGRFQFGILYGDDLIGVADCKLDDDEEGLAHIGMILLAPAFDDPAIQALAVRVLERWLAAGYGVRRIETGALAHVPAEIAFWQQQGYEFTGAQYRRDLPGYAPRFLVLAKDLT